MDIKGALNSILPLNLRAKTDVDRTIKSGNATERDANGQTTYDQGSQQERPPMSDEQLEKAIQQIKDFPAVKEYNLTVELQTHQDKRFVVLIEADGKILRRIPEIELWNLPAMNDSEAPKKGQLLRKMA